RKGIHRARRFFPATGNHPAPRAPASARRPAPPFNIVDPGFGALRKKYEPQALPQARLGSWWRECVLGPLEPFEFRLDDRSTGQTAAKGLFWEMTDYGWRGGAAAAGVLRVQVRNEQRR